MIVTVLGSSAKQTNTRECVSILLDTDKETILFDTGPGIVSSLDNAKRKASEINSIILTHVHGDHILGFAYYIWARNSEIKSMKDYSKEKYKLVVYGQKDTIELAKSTLNMAYPNMKLLFEIIFIEIKHGFVVNLSGDYLIEFYDAIHAVPTVSTIVKDADKKFVYTSDSLPNMDLYEAANGATILIHEGMYTNDSFEHSRKAKHSTSLDAAVIAKELNAKQLVLVHIAPKMFGKESSLLSEVASVFDGIISVPFDGTVYYV